MWSLSAITALFMVLAVRAQETTQTFQAERFLDMLGKTFDPNVAYLDLLTALHKRMNLATPVSLNGTSRPMGAGGATADAGVANPNTIADASPNCPVAPPKPGTAVTYTSDTRIMGSRAFYQCQKGFEGRSLFVLCQSGGQWTDTSTYAGCRKIDCSVPPPSIEHGNSAYTATTYGAIALYSCETGYKLTSDDANVTCLETGQWSSPNFQCEKKAAVPDALSPANLGSLAPLFGAAGGSTGQNSNNAPNPMMMAMMKAMSGMGGGQMPSGFPSMNPPTQNAQPPPAPAAPAPPNNNNNNNNNNNQQMMSMIAKMFPGFAPPTPPPTTTTPAPVVQHHNIGGFQLPSHLQSLLPNGISNPKGMNPQDLMTLASMGLGSANSAAAPRDITQLLGTMNPMSLLTQTMGMGGAGGAGQAGGTPGAPADPEKMAEQREEMMMRAMMASTLKSMMAPQNRGNNNNTSSASPQRNNPAMDMMTLMALQGSLGGQSGGGGGGGGMDPMTAMLGGMSPSMLGLGGMGMPGGGGGGGLFGDLFGSA